MKEIWRLLTTITEDPNMFTCGPLAVRRKTLREFAVTPFAVVGLAVVVIISVVVVGPMNLIIWLISYDFKIKASKSQA